MVDDGERSGFALNIEAQRDVLIAVAKTFAKMLLPPGCCAPFLLPRRSPIA